MPPLHGGQSTFAAGEVLPHVRHARLIAPAVVCAVVAAAFLPCLTFDLLEAWDDQVYVLQNLDRLRFSLANVQRWFAAPYFANYHPLTMLTYMVDAALWGTWGPGYHLQNLLWHLTAVLGVYALGRRLGLSVTAAAGAAAIWGVHPLRDESVAWISERKDVVCGALYCWGLALALPPPGPAGAQEARPPSFFPPFLFFIAAWFGKSMAVSFPFALLCAVWVCENGPGLRRELRRVWPYAFCLALMIPVTYMAQKSEHGVREGWRFSRQIVVAWSNLFRYLRKVALPWDLNPIYPLVRVDAGLVYRTTAATVVLAVVFFLVWRFRRRFFRRILAPAVFAWCVMLGPVIGLVPLGGIDYADRYTYLPTVPLMLLLGAAWHAAELRWGRTRPLVVGGALALGLAAVTFFSTFTWRNIESLFSTAASVENANPVALGTWGNCLIRMGRYREALRMALNGIEQHPNHPRFLYLLARSLDKLGRKEDAYAVYRRLIGRLDSADFYAGLADCCRDLGRNAEAEVFYSLVVDLEPRNYDAFLNRGVVRFRLGKTDGALADFRRAAELRPDRPEPLLNTARALAAAGRRAEAERLLRNVLQRYPESADLIRRQMSAPTPQAPPQGVLRPHPERP